MTIMIGIDPHKATHTAVAVDENEVVLGEFKVPEGVEKSSGLMFRLVGCGWGRGRCGLGALKLVFPMGFGLAGGSGCGSVIVDESGAGGRASRYRRARCPKPAESKHG